VLPVALAVAVTGVAIYNSAEDAVFHATTDNLEVIARLKGAEIQGWLFRGQRNVRWITGTPGFAATLHDWLDGGRRNTELRQRLEQQLRPLLVDHSRVSVRDATDGGLLLTLRGTGGAFDDDSAQGRAVALSAAGNNEPTLDELHTVGDGEQAHVALNVFAPVRVAGRVKPIAVLSLSLDPDVDLFPALQQWPGVSPSAETLLLTHEGSDIVYLNRLRHQADAAQLRLPITTPNLLAARVAEGYTGAVNGVDYSQVPSLGYLLPIAGTHWFVVAKIAEAEADAALHRFVLILSVIAAGLFLAALWWLARHKAALARIERLSRLHATLSAVNDAIVRSGTLDEAFAGACRASVKQGGFKLAWVGRPDAAGERIPVHTAQGDSLDYLEGIRIDIDPESPFGSGPTAIAFREQRTVVCKDFASEPTVAPWRKKAARYGMRSSIALPISWCGASQGVLTAYSGTPDSFDSEARSVLADIADTLSFAVRHFAAQDDRKRISAALVDSEAWLQEAQRIGKIGHWTYDLASNHISWSPEMFRLFGRDPRQGPADLDALAEHYLPDSAQPAKDGVRQAIRMGGRVELEQEIRLPDGATAWHAAVIVPRRDAEGRTISLHGTVQDITTRKLSEIALTRVADRLEKAMHEVSDLYENAPCGYHSVDKDGIIRRVNATELKWLGYTPEEVVGRRITEFQTPATAAYFAQTFPLFVATGEIRDFEMELVRKDGTILPALISATAVRDEAGNFLVSRSTVYDIGERKEMERVQAEYSRRLADLSRHLVAVQEEARRRLSGELHDRTSPNLAAIEINLGVIGGTLLDEASPDIAARLEDTAALIQDTAASIREICADLRPPVLDYAGLLPAVEAYAHQFARRTGVAVRVDGQDGDCRLRPELESLLFRIVQEALTNAAKHANASSIEVALSLGQRPIVVTVADDGGGFEPELLGRKAGPAAGLGVLTMREMAEFAGGRFHLDSSPGNGTRIHVEI
jgi:PAS domain S-box-containing protein